MIFASIFTGKEMHTKTALQRNGKRDRRILFGISHRDMVFWMRCYYIVRIVGRVQTDGKFKTTKKYIHFHLRQKWTKLVHWFYFYWKKHRSNVLNTTWFIEPGSSISIISCKNGLFLSLITENRAVFIENFSVNQWITMTSISDFDFSSIIEFINLFANSHFLMIFFFTFLQKILRKKKYCDCQKNEILCSIKIFSYAADKKCRSVFMWCR